MSFTFLMPQGSPTLDVEALSHPPHRFARPLERRPGAEDNAIPHLQSEYAHIVCHSVLQNVTYQLGLGSEGLHS